ncbi:S41 family peptidase [Dorea acetigenes]|uniref:S41 family peptidase n=1 Tax=Dorea acetigenes TaxID=2981787 RepID=A0ABT2RPL1_9FIRM|nr:S41 family peptidase [Dorea acetigenes]MCB6416302.1 S41 family peptidase [Faecalimonas umbilicata]MCU6687353.1 S41 family peptidase [Dorea acetigenes]SCJ38548.1 Carboxy-terminal processing protease CtpB precursor [uncultured Clostridium sp.]
MKQKSGFLKGALCGALTALLIVGLVSCGIIADKRQEAQSAGQSADNTAEAETKLQYLKALIDEYFIEDIDEEKLTEGIYKGYIDGLEDPYSVYYDEEETREMNETTSGEYQGVGFVVSQDKDTEIITVLQVYEDSPAQEAGIKDGDILYKVDGEELSGLDLTEVVRKIKGEEGTEVELTVLRGDNAEEVTVTAVRRTIEAQTVSHEMKENGVGYIRISEFDSVTYEQYKTALEDLEANGMQSLIVDLRSNPGGNLVTVCDILDLMLPEGTIVYTEDKNGEKNEFTSDEENQFTKPLVVMMNGYSASASEIFAGAVQDYGTGQIVGTQSYGKGVVQQIFDLKDGTSLKLTIAEYFTPNGRNINGEGITPDVEVEYEYDEANPEADNQLDKAIEVVCQ